MQAESISAGGRQSDEKVEPRACGEAAGGHTGGKRLLSGHGAHS